VITGGCIGVPKRTAAPDPPPPQAPQNAATPGTLDLSQSDGAAQNGPRSKANPRQKFQVHIDFGRIFESQGNYDAAIMEYQDALTVLEDKRHGSFQPADEALAHRRIGGALDRLGRFALAEVHYKKALKLARKDPRVWNDAGYSYYLQGRFNEAELAFKTALKLAPDDERAKTNLGLALAAAGKSEEALPLLSRSSGDAVGHANLGYLLAATGQLDLARQQYETALALRPDLELARRALVQLDRQQRGTTDLAASPVPFTHATSPVPPLRDASVQITSAPAAGSLAIPPPRPWAVSPPVTSPQ
jgi:tetratricopeptide (TPR) repeat protein